MAFFDRNSIPGTRIFQNIIFIFAVTLLIACERENRQLGGLKEYTSAEVPRSSENQQPSVHAVSASAGIADVLPGAVKSGVLDGAVLFQTNCAACHQVTGQGIPGAFPPLVNSPYVTGDVDRLAAIMIYGLNGPINVLGQTYAGVMVGLGGTLSNEELAAIASHIRSSWGNAAPAVGSEVFEAARTKHGSRSLFTIQELGEES